METGGSVGVDEASEALAAVRQSHALVAWRGYPAWYWLGTGACLGAIGPTMLLPAWWGMAGAVGIGAVLIFVTRAASRVRGVCEGWYRRARPFRDRVLLAGPAALVLMAGAGAAKFAAWTAIVAAALVFVLFAGTGLALSARGHVAARR